MDYQGMTNGAAETVKDDSEGGALEAGHQRFNGEGAPMSLRA